MINVLKYIFISLSIFLLSCQSSKQHNEVDKYFIKHELLFEGEFIIGKVKNMALINDSIPVLINSRTNSEKVFTILDYPNEKIWEYGDWGQGPDEFLFPTALSIINDSTFTIWDINKKQLSKFQLASRDSIITNHLFNLKDSLLHFEVLPICNNHFVSTGIFSDYRLAILDENGLFRYGYGSLYARDKDEDKVSGQIRSEIYQGKLAVNPSKTKLVQALLKADIISFYELSDRGDLFLSAEQINEYPDYSYKTGVLKRSAPIGYLDVYTTEEYVYALYSGRSFKDLKDKAFLGNMIKIYDWNGTLVKVYELDIDVKVMSVSQDNSRIYAVAYLPDPTLVSFSLK